MPEIPDDDVSDAVTDTLTVLLQLRGTVVFMHPHEERTSFSDKRTARFSQPMGPQRMGWKISPERRHGMTTIMNYIASNNFLEVIPSGEINLITFRGLLGTVENARQPSADHTLLFDLRHTQFVLSILDIYQLVTEFSQHRNIFRRRVAFLVSPGTDFNQARFLETCACNRGFSIRVYSDYKKVVQYLKNPSLSVTRPPL